MPRKSQFRISCSGLFMFSVQRPIVIKGFGSFITAAVAFIRILQDVGVFLQKKKGQPMNTSEQKRDIYKV